MRPRSPSRPTATAGVAATGYWRPTRADDAVGEQFPDERYGEFIEREAAAWQTAPETLRRLRHAVVDRQPGQLKDDATAVLVEWRRGAEADLLPPTALAAWGPAPA